MADETGNGSGNGNGALTTGSGSTVESILRVLMSQLQNISKAETVTGQPIQADKTTIIPVSRVAIGFAAGGTDAGGDSSTRATRAKLSVGGTGGGITVEPIAFIVVGPDQKPQLLSIKGSVNPLTHAIDLIPDALSKLAGMMPAKAGAPALSADGGQKDSSAAPADSERKRKPQT